MIRDHEDVLVYFDDVYFPTFIFSLIRVIDNIIFPFSIPIEMLSLE